VPAAPATLPPGPRQLKSIQTLGWWARPISFLEGARARYGRRFTIHLLGQVPFVMLTDPDEVKELFTAPPDVLHPGEGARILEPVLGRNSVILLDEDEHLEQRKLMLPAFHGEKMQRLSDLMDEVSQREAESWPQGEPVALHPRLQALTLEVILRAVFGLDPGPRLDLLRERLTKILSLGTKPFSLLPAQKGIGGSRGPWARLMALRGEADDLIFELIDERREDPGDRDDVLAMLLEARHDDGEPMSPQELRDELMTLLVAGHETTASQLAWTFERLVRTPAVLERLADEIRDGDDDQPYLTATIQESLRRRPVLGNAAPRYVRQPVEVGGWEYPEDVCLVANAYLIHHDPAIYPDPYAFQPERFLDEPPGTYTWIPFGGGRRRCLGASFALLEMRIVLRSLLRARELRPVTAGAELPRRRNITVRPGRGSLASLPARARVKAVAA
jgi:cytochrome P450